MVMKTSSAQRKTKVTGLIALLVLLTLVVFAPAAQVQAATTLAELQAELKVKYPEGLPRI